MYTDWIASNARKSTEEKRSLPTELCGIELKLVGEFHPSRLYYVSLLPWRALCTFKASKDAFTPFFIIPSTNRILNKKLATRN